MILPRKYARMCEHFVRESFAFYKSFEEARYEAQSRLCGGQRCTLRFKGAYTVYIRRAVVMDEGHTRMMAVVRARGILVSHLVRFHRQKCRRRICSFRHDAVAVDHPYSSPRESGSQTASRKGRRCE